MRRVRECSRSYHSVGISAGRYHDAVTVHCAVHPGFPGPEAKKISNLMAFVASNFALPLGGGRQLQQCC